MKTNKKTLMAIGAAIVTATIILSVFAYIRAKYQYLTLDFSAIGNSTVTIQDEEKTKEELNVEPGERIRLTKGTYRVSVTGNSIAEHSFSIILEDTAMTVPVQISLSKEMLEAINKRESEGIRIATEAAYPESAKLYEYSINVQKDGNWGTVKLTSKSDHLNDDTLYLILEKEGTDWRVVTTPAIVIGSAEYPNIPQEVLDSIIPPIHTGLSE